MKKIKQIVEVPSEEEGLESLLGEQVTLWCMNYIYHGNLVGVNNTFVVLENAAIVYETGPLCDSNFKDIQKLPSRWNIMTGTIESFGKREIIL